MLSSLHFCGMADLRITTIQTELAWQSPSDNHKAFEKHFEGLAGNTDLVVLPETFTTGFTMDARQQGEDFPGATIEWMMEQASKLDAVIIGSYICKVGKACYNRLIWMRPDGSYDHYDKRHLFAYAGEDDQFTAGKERKLFSLKGWSVCPLICYDLRFPVWSKNQDPAYDLLIYIANWPAPRKHAWRALIAARAIENQSYALGVNRIGKDGNDYSYKGGSVIFNYNGECMYEGGDSMEVQTTALSMDNQLAFRSQFPFLESSDTFKLLID